MNNDEGVPPIINEEEEEKCHPLWKTSVREFAWVGPLIFFFKK